LTGHVHEREVTRQLGLPVEFLPHVAPHFRGITMTVNLWLTLVMSADSIKSLLEHPAATSLVAVAGEPKIAIGFIIGQLAADEAEILSIGVSPNWQRAGLGTRLLEGLARAARRGEAKRIFLEVAQDNAPAVALYRKLGFVEAGRRKRYYERPGSEAVDALTLVLTLQQ